MGMSCSKEERKGRCCCTCNHQRVIMKHPWNKGDGKGRIAEVMGYGCEPPDFAQDGGKPSLVFFDGEHGMCEMHDFEPPNA